MAPIRGDRLRVEIPEVTREFNGDFLPVVSLMKRGIMEWFDDLQPLALNDERVQGTFAGESSDATNTGRYFYRRIGGFRTGSWTLTKLGKFDITEYFFDEAGEWQSETNQFKSITFGMPGGVTVREIIEFLRVHIPENERDEMRRIRTPEGVSYNLDIDWDRPDEDIEGGENGDSGDGSNGST